VIPGRPPNIDWRGEVMSVLAFTSASLPRSICLYLTIFIAKPRGHVR
jgi:hypothetical protein